MQRIFLTHIVPRDKVLKYHLSSASCNFCYNLIESGIFDKTFSILPSFVKGNIDSFDGLVYSSLRKNKLRHFAPIVENLKIFRIIPRDASVWYYNCTILNITLILLLKLLKPKVKQQIIILDYTPSKKIFDRFLLWVSNHLNGTIRLADSPLFTCTNSVCLPGVVPSNAPQFPEITDIKREFLISGELGYNISMLPMLLEVFSQLPHCTLHITGKAPDITLIEKYTSSCNNIIYHGMVSREEYLQILHNTPFLLSTRNPNSPENKCNFPSKIIEGLLHNRIILSTLHYEQLNGIKYFQVGCNKDSFKQSLMGITNLPLDKLVSYANQSDLIRNKFNSNVWKNYIVKIENCSL